MEGIRSFRAQLNIDAGSEAPEEQLKRLEQKVLAEADILRTLENAKRTAQSCNDPYEKARGLASVAESLAAVGLDNSTVLAESIGVIEGAEKIAYESASRRYQNHAVVETARILVRLGTIDPVYNVLSKSTYGYDDSGRREEREERKVSDDAHFAKYRRDLRTDPSDAKALEMVRIITSNRLSEGRTGSVLEGIRTLYETGRRDEARNICESFLTEKTERKPQRQALLLGTLAKVKKEYNDDATREVEEIKELLSREDILSDIYLDIDTEVDIFCDMARLARDFGVDYGPFMRKAQTQIESPRYDGRYIKPYELTDMYVSFAKLRNEFGYDDADKYLLNALGYVEEQSFSLEKCKAQHEIAVCMAQNGFFEDAKEIADRIPTSDKPAALSSIASIESAQWDIHPSDLSTLSTAEIETLVETGRDDVINALGYTRPELIRHMPDMPEALKLGAAERLNSKELAFAAASKLNDETRVLSRAVATHEYDTASTILMQRLMREHEPTNQVRLLKALIEIENPKGRALATSLFANRAVPARLRKWLAQKLISERYWDAELGTYLRGKPDNKTEPVLTAMIHELGLTPDMTSYQLLERPGLLKGATLQDRITELRTHEQSFSSLAHPQLLEKFKGDKDSAKIFYLLHGGRYRYTLINDYAYEKFSTIIEKSASLTIDDDGLSKFSAAMRKAGLGVSDAEHITAAMRSGSFPGMEGGPTVSLFRADAHLGSALEGALSRMQTVWNDELKALIICEAANEKPENIAEASQRASKSVLREKAFVKTLKISEKLDGKGATKIAEACRKELIQSARQKKNKADETRIQGLSESSVLQEYVAKNLPGVSQTFAFSEWASHLRETLQALRDAEVRETSVADKGHAVELELTFLDKGKDFIRAVRFADGQQCCFNSKNYNAGGNVGSADWIARLNRDPLSFAMDIKRKDSNIISGFVFGRMGIDPEGGAPIVMLNGLYSQYQGQAVIDNVLSLIETRFARAIGASSIVIASKHGGTLPGAPTGYLQAKDRDIEAIRALQRELKVYDDIGTVANGPFKFDGYEKALRKSEP